MNRKSLFLFFFFFGTFNALFSSGVGGYSASNTFTVNSGNSTFPTYRVASASISGDPVYVGVVSSRDSSSVTFGTGTDENNNTTYPFAGSNVFNPNVQIPNLTATVSPSTLEVTSISISYPGSFDSSGTVFSAAPEIIIDSPYSGSDGAEANATIDSDGKITSINIISGGSGYNVAVAPVVTVVAGPHFLRNTTVGTSRFGRYFLISSNTTTSLTLDTSRNNGDAITAVFLEGDTVEVVPAPTLGSLFGNISSALPTNWTASDNRETSDWLYIWEPTIKAYFSYYYLGSSPTRTLGWYRTSSFRHGIQNSKVIYPDEAFIIAKRTSNNVTFSFEGTIQTSDQSLYLPEGYNQVLMNNPYGTDLLLGELIPSTEIGTATYKFRPGSSATAADTDTISLLQSDGSWKTFYYDSASTSNPGITAMHEIGVRRPLAAGGGLTATTMDSNDFYIGSGAITDLKSCTDAAGSNELNSTSNDGNYTKITLSGATSDLKGFQITLSSVQGYKLNDDGSKEVNISTNLEVDSPTRGSVVYSNLIGTHEIVGSGSGYVVIEKQRDVTLKADEQDAAASNATVTWSIGALGSGYNANATFYCIGGGASANAKGTISTTGTITVSSGGTGYSASPQVVVTGGGWRTASSGSTSRGDETIGATDGVMIYRGHSTGIKTFIASSNPNN